ncbi:hypothetical protein KEI82_002442 [Staphylococcus pseudintermedius]|uniref:phage tail assembly chaperone GT n=1 Tax=Staphylococcus pseudintermedius TaxID=283734 RepID=UPI0018F37FC2|nr:hypothetical protein [Staphylococcus pseudintermedius]EGQ3068543.1 hypothetical protein [Staphylococcus pseudintermedius]EGQ3151777.1 hypothetical protein [Staphylococcus pseudintermedius]EGQ3871469.1 hypothetical protein [Staphylococcus pseudintermedius]EHL7209586.1 hypothetical protein [Staphylococcus pseudintermedius]EHT6215630.1 hypothetical protein [Staphylococcus pseudintermedius]
MKNNTIELAIKFDEKSGLPIKYNTFVTRPSDITFGLVYECSSFLDTLQGNPDTEQIETMIDLVLRIYGEQFDRLTLIDGLEAHKATQVIFNQILFVATGKSIDDELKDDEAKNTKVNSWKDHKNNLKALYQSMAKEQGSNPKDILELPFYFVFDDLNKGKARSKTHSDSMLQAFGGSAFG